MGIGRELYTSPFIWISGNDCNIENRRCYDKFVVQEIGYDEARNISRLVIRNEKSGKVVFDMSKAKVVDEEKFICSSCKNVITPWISAGKTKMSVREIAQNSEKEYGQRLCLDCIRKRYPDGKMA